MKYLAIAFAILASPAAATQDMRIIDGCWYRPATEGNYWVLLDPTCGPRVEGGQSRPVKVDPKPDPEPPCKPRGDKPRHGKDKWHGKDHKDHGRGHGKGHGKGRK